MKSKDNNVPVVSWCCGRVQSPNDVKQKNEKTQSEPTMVSATPTNSLREFWEVCEQKIYLR